MKEITDFIKEKWLNLFGLMMSRYKASCVNHSYTKNGDDIDLLYMSRKEGRKGLDSTEDKVDTSIRRLEEKIKKGKGRLISPTRNNTNNTMINRITITRKQKWEEKQLYENFKRNLKGKDVDMIKIKKPKVRN